MGNYGDRIKKAREAVGLTQEQLGKKIGVTGVTIMRYEKNQREPRQKQLQAIASALGVSVDTLYGISDETRAEIEHTVEYIHNNSEGAYSEEEIRKSLIENAILDKPHNDFLTALEAADKAIIEKFNGVPDKYLREELLEHYKFLNRRGRIEALLRIGELEENHRFKK